MAAFVFNNVKGRFREFTNLPATDDALMIVLLKSGGLEADDVLNNYNDLAALLAATNDEADFTNYDRRNITVVTDSVDDTLNEASTTVAEFTYLAAGGTIDNSLGKLVVCYLPVVTPPSADSAVIPLFAFDVDRVTDGSDFTATPNSSGLATAREPV